MIVIGMDGLDPVILEKMMGQGQLPVFKSLISQGTFSPLQTSNPPQSPVAWSCFISGANPGHHDVFDFIARDPKTYLPEIGMTEKRQSDQKGFLKMIKNLSAPSIQTRRKGKSFWDHLSENGIESIILRCPVTFPAEPLKGRLITGMGTPDVKGTQGIFSFFTTKPVGDKDIQGRVVNVQWNGNEIATELTGPKVLKDGKPSEVSVPVQVTRVDDSTVRIAVQDEKQDLKIGEWSGWFHLRFDIAFGKKIHGICRFHLNALTPELELYSSAVNIDPRNPSFPISYPPDYAKDMCDHIGDFYTQGMPYDTWALNEGKLDEEAFLKQSYHILEENLASMRVEFDRFKSGLFFCYFGVTDLVQHMFWRYVDPQHPNKGKSTNPDVQNAIKNIYIRMDQVLAEILKQVDDNTMLVLISDHGFGSFRRTVHVNSWLRDNGYLALLDNSNVGEELFANVDWENTRAYCVGFGGIYVNQFGRERSGVVYKGAETDQLKNEIAEKLKLWKDSNGAAIVKKIYRKEEMYSGPYSDNGPDLFIGFDEGYRASWQTALGAAPELLIENNMRMWGGDHLCDPSLVPGVFISNRKLSLKEPGLVDVAPIILDYFGISSGESSEQKNLSLAK